MKVLIVGTSNSLVKGGWYDGFVAAFCDAGQVQRLGLGGAPFSQFLSSLSQVREKAPDHIVLECAANDESYPTHVGSDIFFDRLYHIFLSSLRSIAPVTVLRIPPQLTIQVGSPVVRRQALICRQLDCDFYDSAEQILNLGRGKESAFRDKYHPRTEIAHIVGQNFAVWLKERLDDKGSAPSVINYEACIQEVSVHKPGLPTARIETALLTEDFTVLKPGVSIKLPRTEFILGFFVNSGETRGVLRMFAAAQHRDLFCYYMEASNKNVKRFIPVPNGMYLQRLSSIYAHEAANLALHTDLFYFPQQLAIGKLVTINMDSTD